VDPGFLSLPLDALADTGLQAAAELGVSYASVRVHRLLTEDLQARDNALENARQDLDLGVGVRVIVDGTWGFSAGVDLTLEAVVTLVREAVAVAKAARLLNAEPIALAQEPVHVGSWVSAFEVDPFSVGRQVKVERLLQLCGAAMGQAEVDHVDAQVSSVQECTYLADSHGTRVSQMRVRTHATVEGTRVDPGGGFETMRTLAMPVARGWEWMVGGPEAGQWDFDGEVASLGELLVEKAKASSVEPGRWDLVIDPSNLWLTIHESVGHATELDRALGYEAAYAGTSFATLDQLGSLRYGSDLMHVTGDRTATHGLSTVGYDDEGVAGQSWDLVTTGTLTGYQLDRRMARQNSAALGVQRSNGCAYADSYHHVPIQRMANVSLQPDPDGPDVDGLIAQVERGIYVVGDKSWSIDMQRYNFQFTGQRFYEILNGHLAGPLRDVAYQATTPEFWGSLDALGGPSTYQLGGAMNCGKGQPGQVAPVSHGCPATLFRGVNVLNTVRESGR
jgi:TldD protein